MQVQCANARKLASYLAAHPKIAVVHHPSLVSHAGHQIAKAQMQDFGAMLSVEVDGNASFARAIANHAKVFKQATSLGGTESLIEHRASIEAPPTRTPDTLLRMSVGLENIDDLLMDLEQAIENSVDG